MPPKIDLPNPHGRLETYRLTGAAPYEPPRESLKCRQAFAAAHVVADPLTSSASTEVALDWDATLAYRRHLWDHGLGVAEAMDTAQRGMGLDWPSTRELIALSCAEAKAEGGKVVCGANTDQLTPGRTHSMETIASAYLEQCEHIQACGGDVVMMASRDLAANATGYGDYASVYRNVLSELDGGVILHWLGGMFDPSLRGYWGSSDLDEATESFLDLVADNAEKIVGVKVSLLDDKREVALRRALPPGVRLFTGDDFHYPELILGDGTTHSDALLGIFDAIAPAAAAALAALDEGDEAEFSSILGPTVPLSRHVFRSPTAYYKVGVVFMAYLNGHQDHFRMVGGLESGRSLLHLVEVFKLADKARLLREPELSVERMKRVMATCGIA